MPREFKLLQSGTTGSTVGDDDPEYSIPISDAKIEGTQCRDRAETGFRRSDEFEIGTASTQGRSSSGSRLGNVSRRLGKSPFTYRDCFRRAASPPVDA